MLTISTSTTLTVIWRTPIGPMEGVITPAGLSALRFPPPGRLVLGRPTGAVHLESFSPADEHDPDLLRLAGEVTQALENFFQGRPSAGLPPLDWSAASPFDRLVWEATSRIPYGQTRTYGQVAEAIGRPGSARAVGGALGRNPIVLLVPCHRVIGAAPGAHQLTGFTGGLDLKRDLLERESAH